MKTTLSIVAAVGAFVLMSVALLANPVQKHSEDQADIQNSHSVTIEDETPPGVIEKPKMQVVFLLDATGSMAGLIGAAKEKIWSIASSLAQTDPEPELELGMVFYRDRGDVFVTRRIPLGTPMDDLYEVLMAMNADGGGDGPESVNQALHEGLTMMQWDQDPKTYRAMFLVGDWPPHMDYDNDIHYPVTCKTAKENGIVINTILMGDNYEARQIWKEVASLTEGEFIQTDMSVNNIEIKTPYDEQIMSLQRELDLTRVYYGSALQMNESKAIQSSRLMSADVSANARRAEFNVSKAGKTDYYGTNELLNDIEAGASLDKIEVEELPDNLREMSAKQREDYVAAQLAKRKELEKQIAGLSRQRQQYIDEQLSEMDSDAVENSFDALIFNAVKQQAADKDIIIEGKAKR